MLSLRLESVHIHHTFEVWSTEDREARRLTTRSTHEFNVSTPGLLCISSKEKSSPAVDGVGTLEFSEAVPGEHFVAAGSVRLKIFVDVKGFQTDMKYNLETLRDQCDTLSAREQRYASHVEGYEPTFVDEFGLRLPKYFVAMRVRDARGLEPELLSQMRELSLARRGSKRAAFSTAEAISTLVHFCAARVRTGTWGSTARVGKSLRGDSSQLAHEMYLMASQMRGTGYMPTIVVVLDSEGVEHSIVALEADDTEAAPVVVDPTVIMSDADCPPEVKEVTHPSYTRVLAQYASVGSRVINVDYNTWSTSHTLIPWRRLGGLDEMVLLKALQMHKEVPTLDGEVIKMSATGESGKTVCNRYMALGRTEPLSGCRSLTIKARLWEKIHTWNEYVTF